MCGGGVSFSSVAKVLKRDSLTERGSQTTTMASAVRKVHDLKGTNISYYVLK